MVPSSSCSMQTLPSPGENKALFLNHSTSPNSSLGRFRLHWVLVQEIFDHETRKQGLVETTSLQENNCNGVTNYIQASKCTWFWKLLLGNTRQILVPLSNAKYQIDNIFIRRCDASVVIMKVLIISGHSCWMCISASVHRVLLFAI